MSQGITFVDPGPKTGGFSQSSKYAPVVFALAQRPGEWALVSTLTGPSSTAKQLASRAASIGKSIGRAGKTRKVAIESTVRQHTENGFTTVQTFARAAAA